MIMKQTKLLDATVEQVKIWNSVQSYYSEIITYLYKYDIMIT